MIERDIFLALLDLDPEARAAYLDRACGGDGDLRARVEALLRSHVAAGSFLGTPAVALPDPNTSATQQLGGQATPGGQANADDAISFLTPAGRPDSLGRIGHYEVLEVLGRGAFGVVFRAFDEKLHRMVALKILSTELADNATARRRFVREARAAAIHNEHVVNVFAVDEQPVPHLVMEYVCGQTLQDKLDRDAPIELKEVLRIGQQIADGLAAAHAIGLIHRDIKPANILLENGVERVKISDFGLARAADDGTITQSGVISGTPMYMAPEQAQDDTIDHRADLFSLGSVLYVMCTGRPPFRAASTIAVLKRVCEETPRPIREINPEVPAWLCDIISRLHEKKPDDRFATAREVADLLARCLAEFQQRGQVRSKVSALPARAKPASVSSPPAPRRRRLAVAAAGVVALGIAGLGLTEATGVTDMRGTVIRLFSADGTLVVEVDDPKIGVTIDGGDVVITGAGVKEIRLKPGEHRIQTSKDGKPLRQELMSISKNGRQVVRVSREGDVTAGQAAPVAAKAPPPAVAPFDAAQAKAHQQAWAKYLGAGVVTTNSLGMKMVLIPPGTFIMGAEKTEPGWQEGQGPKHEVEISKPFALGAYEVTVGQFKAFVKATRYVTETEKNGGAVQWDAAARVHKRDPAILWNTPGYEQTDEHPVVCVTWNDAQAFCKWLSDKEGVAYALPTEAQWEYACRAGTTTARYFGDAEDELDAHAWTGTNAEQKAHPVGQKRPNPWGLYDLYGNAWEYTADCYDAGYYAISPRVDPPGADGDTHAMRGGSRIDWPALYRSGAREQLGQDWSNNVVGFRVIAGVRRASSADAAAWEKSVAALPTEEQLKAVVARLRKLNPEFNGQYEHTIEGDQVVSFVTKTPGITDLSPLRALTGLRNLEISGSGTLEDLTPLTGLRLEQLGIRSSLVADLSPLQGMALTGFECTDTKVADLSPLRQMPLRDLQIAYTPVKDLSPLKGMKLEQLNCDGSQVADLAPLEGQPLTKLNLHGTKVSNLGPLKGLSLKCLYCDSTPIADLSPLAEMPLQELYVQHTRVATLSPLAGMPLQHLNCSDTPVDNLTPLKGMKLISLYIDSTPVTDLSPLQGMPLKTLNFREFKVLPSRDGALLRSLKQLENINSKPAAEFFKDLDATKATDRK